MDFLEMLKKAAGDAAGEILETHTLKNDEKYVKELQHIYVKSLTRIFKVIDKLSAGPLSDHHGITISIEDKLPDENQPKKYFAIGDRVVIGCSYQHFKYIQKKVPAWKKNMRNLFPQPGIVTDQNTTKDTTVQVYFPRTFSSCAISTAVLKIDPDPDELVSRCQWKVGDFVQTTSDKRVVKVLMRRLPDIPNKLVGQPGKVIAVTTAGIFVTYDGLRSYAIDSALLKTADHPPTFEIQENVHPSRGIQPGDKVKVISSLKRLIENQKGKGGWNKKMCRMAGQIGYVTDINDDGTLDVACGFGKGWRMNDESLLKMDDELETTGEDEELTFNPGDKVKLRVAEDIRMHLISKNIPLVFLEYLLMTGEVQSIDDDFDAWTRFNSTSQTCMQMSSLVKASPTDVKAFEDIRKRLERMKVGDTVYFDVGPPNYVRTALSQHGADSKMTEALTSVCTIAGWTDHQHVAVELSSGEKYRINKKYLTTPDRFDVQENEQNYGLETVKEMQNAIEDCVKTIHEEQESELLRKSCSVELYAMIQGQLPTVEFRIRSSIANSSKIREGLEEVHTWNMIELCPDTYIAKGFQSSSQKVKLVLLYNDHLHLSTVICGGPTSSAEKLSQLNGSTAAVSATNFVREKEDKKVQPKISSTEEFKFFELHDKSLSRTVYFPYVVCGPARVTAEPEELVPGKKRKSSFVIGKVNKLNIHDSKIDTFMM